MREILEAIRRRLHEYARSEAPLWNWRELQLEILEVAKDWRRRAAEAENRDRERAQKPRPDLWLMLGDAFWVERDLVRLVCMIEEVLVELERHAPAEEDTPIA